MPGDVQASAATVALPGEAFEVVERNEVVLKGKGPVPTFLVRARRPRASVQSGND